MGIAERKYTDRDVRSDLPAVERIVSDYLESYEGEFEFLVDCKQRLAIGVELTVGMMKGVLNCIRVDARYRGELPAFDHTYDAEVIPMPRDKSGRHPDRRKMPRNCDIEEYHDQHLIGPEEWGHERWRCYGKFELNREPYSRAGVVPSQYTGVVAKTGSMIHGLSGSASILWTPNRHEPGFYEGWNGVRTSVEYQTLCMHPRWIKNGILLKGSQVDTVVQDRSSLDSYLEEYLGYELPPSQRKPLSRCKRCF